jgi:hypothetical protein
MSIDSLSAPDYFELPLDSTDNNYSFIVNECTGEVEETVNHEFLRLITDQDGLLNSQGIDYFGIDSGSDAERVGDFMVDGTFFGGPQTVMLEGLTFRGGRQIVTDATLGGSQSEDNSIKQHEMRYLDGVLSEIFDGRHDLAEIDKHFLLNPDSGMPQTLRRLFINKPGHNGGVSSIRHIFRGDKSGGLHVPAFAPELIERPPEDPHTPFEAVVSINGVSKLKVIHDATPRLVPAKTSMFPAGLDSLAVMQCVIDAWEHKGDWQSSLIDKRGDVSNIYEVPVIVEGAFSPMVVRLVTHAGTVEEKIRTAFPVIPVN